MKTDIVQVTCQYLRLGIKFIPQVFSEAPGCCRPAPSSSPAALNFSARKLAVYGALLYLESLF